MADDRADTRQDRHGQQRSLGVPKGFGHGGSTWQAWRRDESSSSGPAVSGRRYRIDDPDATFFRRHLSTGPSSYCIAEVSLNPEDCSRHDSHACNQGSPTRQMIKLALVPPTRTNFRSCTTVISQGHPSGHGKKKGQQWHETASTHLPLPRAKDQTANRRSKRSDRQDKTRQGRQDRASQGKTAGHAAAFRGITPSSANVSGMVMCARALGSSPTAARHPITTCGLEGLKDSCCVRYSSRLF